MDTDLLDEENLRQHVKTSHAPLQIQIWKPCLLCGEVCRGAAHNFFHLLSKHSECLDMSYKCSLCKMTFDTHKEHLDHLETSHHSKVSNLDVTLTSNNQLPFRIMQVLPEILVECGLCPRNGGRVGSRHPWRNHKEHISHLQQVHFMKLDQHFKHSDSKKYRKSQPWQQFGEIEYSCPSCPQLGKLSVNAFLLHLSFHRRMLPKLFVDKYIIFL